MGDLANHCYYLYRDGVKISMAKLTVYVSILIALSFILYLNGYTSPFLDVVANVGADQPNTAVWDTFINQIYGIFTDPAFLLAIGVVAVSSFVLSGAGQSVTFIIPVMIYSCWRMSGSKKGCKCGFDNMIPLDSPRGIKLQAELY